MLNNIESALPLTTIELIGLLRSISEDVNIIVVLL